MPGLSLLVNLLQFVVKNRSQLAVENIALRHRLAVYKRSVKRPVIKDGDRIIWLTVMRMLKEWREALVFVQPATLIKWHGRVSAATGGGSPDPGRVDRRSGWRSSF